MIDFDELKKMNVPEYVSTWCEIHATNHISLLSAWAEEPKYATNLILLTQCLAWATRAGRGVVAARIMGKYRRLRQVQETENFNKMFGDVPTCLL